MSESEPAPRTARVARAATGSALGVLVALAAHLAGGGSVPPAAILLAAAVLVQPAAVLLTGRAPRLWRQAAVVGLGQAAMHVTFALGSAAQGVHAAPGMHGMHVLVALPAGAPTPPPHDMSAMWWWHGVAWALTTVAWRWGDAAVRSLLAAARRLPRLRPGAPVAVADLRLLPTGGPPRRPSDVASARAHRRRGPPVLR